MIFCMPNITRLFRTNLAYVLVRDLAYNLACEKSCAFIRDKTRDETLTSIQL